MARVEKRRIRSGELAHAFGQRAVSSAERRQHIRRMAGIEEVDKGDVLIRNEVDLQALQKPRGSHPEVVTDENDRLKVFAVALAKGGNQLRVLLAPPGKQPLLELVDGQKTSLRGAGPAPAVAPRVRSTRPMSRDSSF